MISGNQLGLSDLELISNNFLSEIESTRNSYEYYVFDYPKTDVYASSLFSATPIYHDYDPDKDLRELYIHILPLTDKTLFLIGYHKYHYNQEMIDFCNSWEELNESTFQTKLTDLFVYNIENWGMSVSLFNRIKKENLDRFREEVAENLQYFGLSKSAGFNLFE